MFKLSYSVRDIILCPSWILAANQVALAFQGINTINQYILQNNHSLPELLPAILQETVDITEINDWLQQATATLQSVGGGNLIMSTLEAFIANSQALLVADLAYFPAHQQVVSLAAQVVTVIVESTCRCFAGDYELYDS